jgi:hypothetical protein
MALFTPAFWYPEYILLPVAFFILSAIRFYAILLFVLVGLYEVEPAPEKPLKSITIEFVVYSFVTYLTYLAGYIFAIGFALPYIVMLFFILIISWALNKGFIEFR